MGYNSEEADEVVIYCAHRGFTNCIDPMIAVRTYSSDFKPEFPVEDVCYWGPDQLLSRLDSLMTFRDLDESDIRR